jgi:hypothetical protein
MIDRERRDRGAPLASAHEVGLLDAQVVQQPSTRPPERPDSRRSNAMQVYRSESCSNGLIVR